MTAISKDFHNPSTVGEMQIWDNGSNELIVQTAHNSIRISLLAQGSFLVRSERHPMCVDGFNAVKIG